MMRPRPITFTDLRPRLADPPAHAHAGLCLFPPRRLREPMSRNNKKVVLVTGGTGLVGKGIADFIATGE